MPATRQQLPFTFIPIIKACRSPPAFPSIVKVASGCKALLAPFLVSATVVKKKKKRGRLLNSTTLPLIESPPVTDVFAFSRTLYSVSQHIAQFFDFLIFLLFSSFFPLNS